MIFFIFDFIVENAKINQIELKLLRNLYIFK